MSVGATETHAHSHPTESQIAPSSEAGLTPGSEAPEALVALSDKAAEKVREIRTEENIEDSYALRLKVQGGGCSGFSYDLYFDQSGEMDRSFAMRIERRLPASAACQ